MENNGQETMGQMDGNLKRPDYIRECKLLNNDMEENTIVTDLTVESLSECPKAAGSTENICEVNSGTKKKRFQKRIKNNSKLWDEIQNVSQTKMDMGSTEIHVENNVICNRKRRAKNKVETQSMNQVDCTSNLHLSDGNHREEIEGEHSMAQTSQEFGISVRQEPGVLHDKDIPLHSCKDEESKIFARQALPLSDLTHDQPNSLDLHKKSLLLYVDQVLSKQVLSEVIEERSEHVLRPMEVDEKFVPCEIQVGTHLIQAASVNLSPGNGLSSDTGEYPRKLLVPSFKRKLIVLDVNGLLANIVMPAPKDCQEDTRLLGRAIFKRPFCDDFLKFCFQNFDVGVWSSRAKKIIDLVVEYLLGDLKGKLLFCWDMSHSTQSGFRTLENVHKPLVFKELKKIWENDDPNLPWKYGDYDESNTLLLDDSPYKALLNPSYTAIFPHSYNYKDKNDNSLGPGGDLRVYLEGLLTSKNFREYVEQNPFGQSAINETDLSWGFYSEVLQSMSYQQQSQFPLVGTNCL